MISIASQLSLVGRRAELMAELLLQDLKPLSLARPTVDVGFDFLVTFKNSRGGINTFGVEVKSSEQKIGSTFSLDKKVHDRLVHSNMPMLLLIADVKRNKLYYHWPQGKRDDTRMEHKAVTVPVVEIDDAIKKALRRRFLEPL